MGERLYTRLAQALIALVLFGGALYAESAHSSGCEASISIAGEEVGP